MPAPPGAHASRDARRPARRTMPPGRTPPRAAHDAPAAHAARAPPRATHALRNHHQISSIVVPKPAIWFSHKKRFQPAVARSLSASVTLR